ncbi:gamma-glutamylcyclotransferase family protein [Szabonella alba]|uniref:Gamma-glutamylcyclotransferase n=1 Tax=Szabonella alba TaxID=2804194 RepID=A0A8K0Y2L7_9RHOB|nr:gamma-glutamylcyclotransferase family protein [Szabonella alba]MBL4918154.1 gamma-glutamylcyclotransferase [Szabonella alba]
MTPDSLRPDAGAQPGPAPHFFGYGSLVNRATHDYPAARPARLRGWRRVWVHTPARDLAFLSVRRDARAEIAGAEIAGAEIEGLVAEVPGADWSALDAREFAYARHPVMADLTSGAPLSAQVYAVPEADQQPASPAHPILLSYLDTVVQGFLREFGAAGAAAFFATTDGWDAPIRDDRAAPLYPRAQVLTDAERAVVDTFRATLGPRRALR